MYLTRNGTVGRMDSIICPAGTFDPSSTTITSILSNPVESLAKMWSKTFESCSGRLYVGITMLIFIRLIPLRKKNGIYFRHCQYQPSIHVITKTAQQLCNRRICDFVETISVYFCGDQFEPIFFPIVRE